MTSNTKCFGVGNKKQTELPNVLVTLGGEGRWYKVERAGGTRWKNENASSIANRAVIKG